MNILLYKTLLVFGFISFCALILLIFCRDSSHFYGFDHKKDTNLLYALFYRFYFVLTTITTIGFGDVWPATIRSKTFVIFLIFSVVIIILNQIDALTQFTQKSLTTATTDAQNVIATIKKDISANASKETKVI